jgi:hypothetical protein
MRNENSLVDIYVADLYDYGWDDVYGWHFWCVRMDEIMCMWMDETYVYGMLSVEWMRL